MQKGPFYFIPSNFNKKFSTNSIPKILPLPFPPFPDECLNDGDMRSLFGSSGDELLLSGGTLDGEVDGLVSPLIPSLLQGVIGLLIINRQLEVRLEVPVRKNHRNKIILIDIGDLQLLLSHVRNRTSGTSRSSILVLLIGEDINTDNRGLGRAVLPGLGSGVLSHPAGEALEHAVTALLDVSDRNRSAVSRSSIALLKGVLLVRHC